MNQEAKARKRNANENNQESVNGNCDSNTKVYIAWSGPRGICSFRGNKELWEEFVKQIKANARLASLHTLLNFSLYANYAHRVTYEAKILEIAEIKKAIKGVKETAIILNWFQIFKSSGSSLRFRAIIVGYAAITALSCYLTIGANEAIVGSILVLAFIAVAWLYMLYRWN